MKKTLSLLMSLILFVSTTALAGILPSSSTLPYAVEMPSMERTLGRGAASDATNAEGARVLTYENVTAEEFDAFSEYLEEHGCELTDYSIDNFVFLATIAKEGASFTMKYDLLSLTCALIYPLGTKVEEVVYSIEGKWRMTGYDEEIIFEFRDGVMATYIDNYKVDEAEYKIEGDSITFIDDDGSETYPYSISGDHFFLFNSNGEEIVFERIKEDEDTANKQKDFPATDETAIEGKWNEAGIDDAAAAGVGEPGRRFY